MKTFYRVGHIQNQQGLWYHPDGRFVGLIHLTDCKCKSLQMPFDEELVGWISVVESLEELYAWFPKEDILKLQKSNFFVQVYEAEDWKHYEAFNHTVINQATSKLVGILTLI